MSVALLLGLFSAITLAFANLAVKMGSDILVGRAILSGSAALLILPFAFVVMAPDAATWQALAWAIPAHLVYQFCLVRAMQAGDLSLVFPVMRGIAPLLTATAALVLLDERLSGWGWLGLLIATGAVIVFALPRRVAGGVDVPDRAALGWALATAIGVALYNVADARGVRIAPEPFTYIVWLFLLDWIGVTVAAILWRRRMLIGVVRAKWRYGVAAGAMSIASFGAALYAMSLIEAAKVSALRETAVLWAAIMGALVLKEGFGARRIFAATGVVAGLAMLQFLG